MSNHTPSLTTAREIFLDGAQGEFIGEDFDRMIEAVRAEALREVRDAWMRAGKVPAYHNQMKKQLRRDWPVLAGALDRIEREAGE